MRPFGVDIKTAFGPLADSWQAIVDQLETALFDRRQATLLAVLCDPGAALDELTMTIPER